MKEINPDNNIEKQISLANELLKTSSGEALELAKLVIALNNWLLEGNRLPRNWEEKRPDSTKCDWLSEV